MQGDQDDVDSREEDIEDDAETNIVELIGAIIDAATEMNINPPIVVHARASIQENSDKSEANAKEATAAAEPAGAECASHSRVTNEESQESRVKTIIKYPELEPVYAELYEEILNEVIIGLAFDVHRAMKCGFLFIDENTFESNERLEEISIPSPLSIENSPEESSQEGGEELEKPGYDIFGQKISEMNFGYISCPICFRKLVATRFASHLAKCMGCGRTIPQRACKRTIDEEAFDSDDIMDEDEDEGDDDNDIDWNYSTKRRTVKKKRGRTTRRPRASKIEDPAVVPRYNHQPITYEEHVYAEPIYGQEKTVTYEEFRNSSTQDDLAENTLIQEVNVEHDIQPLRKKSIKSRRPMRTCNNNGVITIASDHDEIIAMKSKRPANVNSTVQEIPIHSPLQTSLQCAPKKHNMDIQVVQAVNENFHAQGPPKQNNMNIDVDTVDENFHMWKLNFSRSPSPGSSNADGLGYSPSNSC